jgi:hypothetical protein
MWCTLRSQTVAGHFLALINNKKIKFCVTDITVYCTKKKLRYLQCISNDVPDLSSRLLLLAELPPLGGLAAHVGVAVGGGARHSLPHIPAHSQVRSDAAYIIP